MTASVMTATMLKVEQLKKVYTRGVMRRETTFTLEADFAVEGPAIIGVMGPNGSGKTTLFELITGSNLPSSGQVLVDGRNIHQVRSFKRRTPEFMLDRAVSARAAIHLFDEPQFNTQDGYIGFMLDFFRQLRDDGRLVFVCLHPNEPYHVELLSEICDRFLFVNKGKLSEGETLGKLAEQVAFREYLGKLVGCLPA